MTKKELGELLKDLPADTHLYLGDFGRELKRVVVKSTRFPGKDACFAATAATLD